MHSHLEIVMPPTANVEAAVKQVLEPFDESGEDENGNPNKHAFWDFWVIGGRWAGSKVRQAFDKEKLAAFYAALNEKKVTVSGLQCGKEELSPASQTPMVDALWCEHFPGSPVTVCPLFKHYNDQYANSDDYPDIMPLKDMPPCLTASHVIIAGPSYLDDGTLLARHMVQDSFWNGVSHVAAKWDGKVQTVIDEYKERFKNAKPEYAAKHVPAKNWLVVTVDYHS